MKYKFTLEFEAEGYDIPKIMDIVSGTLRHETEGLSLKNIKPTLKILDDEYSDEVDQLEDEIEELQDEISKLDISFALTEDIIKELKQALRICTPYYDDNGKQYHCMFCGEKPHKIDCEYKKMTI